MYKNLLFQNVAIALFFFNSSVLAQNDDIRYWCKTPDYRAPKTESTPHIIAGKVNYNPTAIYILKGKVWNVFDNRAISSSAVLKIDWKIIPVNTSGDFVVTLGAGSHKILITDPTREIWNYNHDFFLVSDTIYTFKMLPKKVDIDVIDWACQHYFGNGMPPNYINNRFEFPVDVYLDVNCKLPNSKKPSAFVLEKSKNAFLHWENVTGLKLFNLIEGVPEDYDPLENRVTEKYRGIFVRWYAWFYAGTGLDKNNYPLESHLEFSNYDLHYIKERFYGREPALHEIGHALGFSHPEEGYNFIMTNSLSDASLQDTIIAISEKEINTIRAKALIDRGISLTNYEYKQFTTTGNTNLKQLANSGIIEPYLDGYLLNGTLTVRNQDKLTFDEGTHLFFEPNTRIRCFGTLDFQGTEDSPIYLQNSQDHPGSGIFLENNKEPIQITSVYNYVNISGLEIGTAVNTQRWTTGPVKKVNW